MTARFALLLIILAAMLGWALEVAHVVWYPDVTEARWFRWHWMAYGSAVGLAMLAGVLSISRRNA